MDYLIPGWRRNWVLINKKKRTCHLVDFIVPANPSAKIKESEMINKNLPREQKKKKEPKTVEHDVDGGTNSSWYAWNRIFGKGLEELETRKRIETIQTTAVLRLTQILRRVLEAWRDLLSLWLQWKTTS